MSQNQPKVKQYLRPSGILCFTSSSTISYLNFGRLALFRAKTSSIHNEFARPLFRQIEIFFSGIRHFHIPHNAPYLPPRFCITFEGEPIGPPQDLGISGQNPCRGNNNMFTTTDISQFFALFIFNTTILRSDEEAEHNIRLVSDDIFHFVS